MREKSERAEHRDDNAAVQSCEVGVEHPNSTRAARSRRCAGVFRTRLPLIALPLGPRAAHMASHILLMNALAPVLASAIISRFGDCAPVFG